jgi:RNA polymerase sigma factor (sigma-70 family)
MLAVVPGRVLTIPVRSYEHRYDAASKRVGGGRVPVSGTQPPPGDPVLDLLPVIRRVVGARVRDAHAAEDLVQETLVRVMAARSRVEGDTLAPYAVVTARNLIATMGQREQRARRNAHLLVEPDKFEDLDEETLRREETSLVAAALARLSPRDREILLAHEVGGVDTASLAAERGSTPGAIAAQLSRTRARLRVEYLLAQTDVDPPTDRCRPVLLALSAGDRRRQRELDSAGHLLSCDLCAQVGAALLDRRPAPDTVDEKRISVTSDPDVVTARQKGREIAARAGFATTDLTLVATAISEIARNIVKFARRGQLTVTLVTDDGRTGVTIVARDSGPGIPDVGRALQDGYSTYRGLGLGLGGARRLMDEFEIVSEVGVGTTVTMTKWHDGRRAGA